MKLTAKIVKRDGRIQDFDIDKIHRAIQKTAGINKEKFGDDEWSEIKPILENELERLEEKAVINISEIDDIVMETLICSRFKTIAIDYIKHRKTKVYNKANDLALNSVAMKLLEERYLETDSDGTTIETPREMMLRIATAIASAEKTTELKLKYKDEFFKLLANLEFLPNSPCLVSAGSKRKGTYLACFAYAMPDSLSEMFDVYKMMANTFKMGGGVGISIADVREEGAKIHSTNGLSSGPLKLVLPTIDAITEGIKQGSFRRGALMCIISDNHPDLEAFIDAKADPTALTNMNMSILVCNKFMSAVKKGGELTLVSPQTGKATKTISASYIMDKIATRIWETGEPGILFKDRINKDNPTPHLGELRLTNPCITGDTLIAVADGRNVVSIKQLAKEGMTVPVYCQAVKSGGILNVEVKSGFSPRLTEKKQDVYKVVLDDGSYIRATKEHPFMLRNGKYTPLGNLKPGDSLMPFNTILDHKVASITYAGKEDVYNITVEDNHNYFVVSNYRADKTSTGVCLKNCAESTLLDREACCLGSINLVRHINSEKKFDWEKFSTSIKIGIRFLDDLLEKSPYPDPSVKKAVFNTRKVGLGIMGFADVLIMLGIKYSSPEACKFADQLGSFMRKVAEQESTKLGKEKGCYEAYKEGCPKRRNAIVLTFAPTGSISLIAGVSSGIEPNFAASYSRTFYPENEVVTLNHPWKDKPCFEVAQDIPPEQHLKVLASFQKHVDNAVSKTINCPESTTIDDIKKLIIMGHELGVKGLTIFRKNCKRKSLIKCDGEQCLL